MLKFQKNFGGFFQKINFSKTLPVFMQGPRIGEPGKNGPGIQRPGALHKNR